MKIYAITPHRRESAWLRYRLALSGSSCAEVGRRLGVSRFCVSGVVNGNWHSARIEAEIARIIGYESWNGMLKALRAGEAGKK